MPKYFNENKKTLRISESSEEYGFSDGGSRLRTCNISILGSNNYDITGAEAEQIIQHLKQVFSLKIGTICSFCGNAKDPQCTHKNINKYDKQKGKHKCLICGQYV